MKHWTQKELIKDGYEIENAQITNVSLNMENHGCLCLDLTLEWSGCGCVYGGYVLGKGYVGADDDFSAVLPKAAKQSCESWTPLENRNF